MSVPTTSRMKTLIALCLTAALAFPAFAQDSTIKTVPVYSYAGAPINGTSEIDTLTIQSGTSAGTFTISVANSHPTDPITWSATDATLIARIQAALVAHPVIGASGATVTAGTGSSGIGTYLITLGGKNAASDFPLLGIGTNALTGGTAPTLTTTTAGVAGTFTNAAVGTVLEDTTNGELYQNISTTAGSPNWQYRGGGWKSGSGGAVTQITSRSTGVTLSKRVGKITTTADSLAAVTGVTFTVTNTLVAATDNIVITKVSGDADTTVRVESVAAGSFTVTLFNTHASAADTTALVFNFEVRKGAID
jgi:hypothetical protein